MAYDRSSINNFNQKQGGSLSNLGASQTYTGTARPVQQGVPNGPNQMPGQTMRRQGGVPGMQQGMHPQAPQLAPQPQTPQMGAPQGLQSLGQQPVNEQALYQQAMQNQMRNQQAIQYQQMMRNRQNSQQAMRDDVMKRRFAMMNGGLSRLGVR